MTTAPDRVRRALISDLEKADFPVKNIVPFIETVHDRFCRRDFQRLHKRLQILPGGHDIQAGKRT